MNRPIKIIIALLLAAVFASVASVAQAQTYKDVIARSMFSDKKALAEGDIITVLIVESAKGTNETDTRTNSDNRMNADASTSGTIGDLIPSFGLDSRLSNQHEARGQMTTRGTLESKMTAVVTEVMDNGLLNIQGTRVVNMNGDEQTTTLTGLVRPEDVSADNVVFSYNIANAQISYDGSGPVTSAGKPGIIARIWNWIF